MWRSRVEGNQQVLIKSGYLKFTFSFELSLSFAATLYNSHNAGMTPFPACRHVAGTRKRPLL